MKTYKSTIPEITLKRMPTDLKKVQIKCAEDVAEFARQFYFDDLTIYESFFLILLNNINNTIGYVKISQGGIAGTIADPQLIAKYAIESLARSVVLVHNHPTGNLNPSKADIEVTKKIKSTLKIFDCSVLDHIILTEETHFSFANENIL